MWNLAVAGADDLEAGAGNRAHGARRPAHTATDLRGVEVELGECAAKGVAMHAQLLGGLALIAAMAGEDFEDESLLELANRIGVREAGGVHLEDESIEFAFHSWRSFAQLQTSVQRRGVVDPVGRCVL